MLSIVRLAHAILAREKSRGILTIMSFFRLAHTFLMQLREKTFAITLMNIIVAIQAKPRQT
jgi:hypothetical protein